MPSINLDFLERTRPRNNYEIYKDVKLDLELGYTFNNEAEKQKQIIDIVSSNNLDAIKNSIVNILTTSPGEKILNPIFGINFGNLLFLPVTEPRALKIGENILNKLTLFEPRIKITNINVIANISSQSYTVSLQFVVPRFENEPVRIAGTLNKSGFYYGN